ncbi:MAG: N-acetylmuramoyl-L-alanine amidase [Bacteroidota bacterium]
MLNGFEGHKSSIILAEKEPPFRIRTIVIDAGHGGHDPGCLGAGYYEKHLALEIAKAFAQKVEEQYPDIQVIMTRDEDVFIPLHERASIANRANADLFISIHCNAMPPGNSGTAGTETFVMGLHTAEHNLDVAKRENASILLEDNYERNYDYDPNSPEGHILLSMFQNAYLEQSILFAERVEHHFHTTAERKSRGVKQAGFVVLKETAMPSVLVEAGFLTNKKDEAFLRSEEGQELVATSLLNALSDYKAILEGQPVETFAAVSSPAVAPPPADHPDPKPVQSYTPPSVPTTPPASSTYESPTVYTYPSPNVQQQTRAVRAEPTIQPTPAQGTIIQSVPAQDRALQPRGKGDTSWAENIGREPSSTTVNGLIYCVQLAASPRPLNTRITPWTNSSFLIEVLQEEEMYKYQVRNFTQLPAATNVKYTVQQQGFPDAFVVAYHNGQRISLEQAKALTTGQR